MKFPGKNPWTYPKQIHEMSQTFLGNLSKSFGFIAVLLAAVNIFGGFLVTQRMLAMYKKKPKNQDKK